MITHSSFDFDFVCCHVSHVILCQDCVTASFTSLFMLHSGVSSVFSLSSRYSFTCVGRNGDGELIILHICCLFVLKVSSQMAKTTVYNPTTGGEDVMVKV